MTRRIVRNGRHWALADKLLGDWLGNKTEVGLAVAMSGLHRRAAPLSSSTDAAMADSAEFIRECMDGSAGADAVSRLLRARGFRKVGMMGSALTYDRQPLYRKEPA